MLRPIACIQAPETGHEAEWGEGTIEPAVTSRTVRVVGAGPAGLEAGRVAALRGHRVHVYDERDRAGGQAAEGAIVPDREEFAKVSDYLTEEVARVGVELHLSKAIEISTVERWLANQDAVLIATGSEPVLPNLPGAADIMTLEAALKRESWSGLRVALVDEIEDEPTYAAAEALVKRGATVQIVTRRPSIGRRLAFVSLMGAFRRLDAAGIEIVPLRSPVRMEGTTLITRHGFSGREWALPGIDAVVFAGPYRARDDLARELHRRGRDVRLVGDAYAPRRALVAILDGHAAGREV
jgi:NADPH-dependent 2,4-dienoyl-CoA reductase/sulfur reductase-like enzyme